MSKTLSTTDSPFATLAALGISFSPVGILLPEGLPVENWQTLMGALPQLGDAVRWALGDALNYGELRYGRKYSAAVDATGIKYDTLALYASVAKRVEFPTRVGNLSWTHHREVADMSVIEQEGWLSHAAEKKLTTRELRAAIDAAAEEEKALEETKARRTVAPVEMPEPDPEPEFAPPIGKAQLSSYAKETPAPTPAPAPERLTFQPLVAREPAKLEPAPRTAPAPTSFGAPQPTAPRTDLLWRNVCRAVFNFTSGTKSLTYIFEIIEVSTDGGFAYDITNNGNSLGRRSSLSGAKQRCEEYIADTLKKAEGK